jgi:hypothetical protein
MQVRDYDIVDACPYTLELQWDKDGEMAVQHIFERNSPFPTAKVLTLLRSKVRCSLTLRCIVLLGAGAGGGCCCYSFALCSIQCLNIGLVVITATF